jgi:electron transport complex protein RnfD
MFAPAPFLLKDTSVSQVMTQVCIALLPGIAAYAWLVGPAILVQLVIASLTALLAEAAMLRLRKKSLSLFLSDGSAIVTAWLIALTFPPLAPWWLEPPHPLANVVAKHLYGGLGQNPFNPAMIAFAVCIVSFPALMSQWPGVGLQMPLIDQINVILGLAPRVDALSSATPLDALKTALKLDEGAFDVTHLLANQDIYGNFAGRGWEWVAAGYLLGGLWMWQRKLITWHVPVAFIGGWCHFPAPSGSHRPISPARIFTLSTAGAMLGAFFLATTRFPAAHAERQMIFGAGAGCWPTPSRLRRYPDGVLSRLLMNTAPRYRSADSAPFLA